MNAYFVATVGDDILIIQEHVDGSPVYLRDRLFGVYLARTRGQARWDFLDRESDNIDFRTPITIRLLAKNVEGERGYYNGGPLWDLVREVWS